MILSYYCLDLVYPMLLISYFNYFDKWELADVIIYLIILYIISDINSIYLIVQYTIFCLF